MKGRMQEVHRMFAEHTLQVNNHAITAARLCEKTLSVLDHLRQCPKDISALISLEKVLKRRRIAMNRVRSTHFMNYCHILKLYGLSDF